MALATSDTWDRTNRLNTKSCSSSTWNRLDEMENDETPLIGSEIGTRMFVVGKARFLFSLKCCSSWWSTNDSWSLWDIRSSVIIGSFHDVQSPSWWRGSLHISQKYRHLLSRRESIHLHPEKLCPNRCSVDGWRSSTSVWIRTFSNLCFIASFLSLSCRGNTMQYSWALWCSAMWSPILHTPLHNDWYWDLEIASVGTDEGSLILKRNEIYKSHLVKSYFVGFIRILSIVSFSYSEWLATVESTTTRRCFTLTSKLDRVVFWTGTRATREDPENQEVWLGSTSHDDQEGAITRFHQEFGRTTRSTKLGEISQVCGWNL